MLRTLLAAAAVLFVALAATGCSGGGSTSAAPKPAAHETVEVAPGVVTIANAGPPATLPDPTRDQIIDTLKRYVEASSVTPLRTGRGAGALTALFTAAAGARAGGADRAVLVDEGIPRATGDITAHAEPVAITALADQGGNVILVSAALQLTVDAKTAKGPVKIQRTGDLLFAPDAGTWKVAGFDLSVARTGSGLGTGAASTSTTGGGS